MKWKIVWNSYITDNIEYADPNSDPALAPQVQDALRRGNKIEAIKIYRELTGVGLAEAKQAVEDIETKLRLWDL